MRSTPEVVASTLPFTVPTVGASPATTEGAIDAITGTTANNSAMTTAVRSRVPSLSVLERERFTGQIEEQLRIDSENDDGHDRGRDNDPSAGRRVDRQIILSRRSDEHRRSDPELT